jgi:hypothetical protein
VVVLNQDKERILSAPGADLIDTEITPPNPLENFKPGNAAKIKDLVRRQRAENQEDLVMRLMEAEKILCWRFSGRALEFESKRYIDAAAAMLECSNMAVPFGDLGVKGLDYNARYLSGVRHCGKPICPNCLPYQDAKRREKLQQVAIGIAELPLNHFIMTITLRHHYSPKGNWKVLVKAIKKTWRKMGKERYFGEALGYKSVKKAVIAAVRGGFFWKMESTFTYEWGHHPHLHVLISLPQTINADEFQQRVKEYWERELKKQGRSCEWQDGWFEPLRKSQDLQRMIKYLTGGITEVTGNASKKLPPWKLPPEAFIEIFYEMKHERWFGSGGCWRTNSVVEAENEKNLEQERESKEPFIYVIKRDWWNSLDFVGRFDVRKIIGNRDLTHEECVNKLNEFFMEFLE